MRVMGKQIDLEGRWPWPAAGILHICLFAWLLTYKPALRPQEVFTPIDLSLFEIEEPQLAEEDAEEQLTEPPPEISEPPAHPETAPVEASSASDFPALAPRGVEPATTTASPSNLPETNLPTIPEDWVIEDNGVWFGATGNTPTEETNALRALSCLRLGRTEEDDPRCGNETGSALPGGLQMARSNDLTGPEIGDNPFASALDLFSEGQYADRTTTYSTFSQRTSDHQHAQPMFSYRSSAERDLTGNLNSAPHPGD